MNIRNVLRGLTLVAALGALPSASFAQFSIGISINIAPPALPVYVQPVCPEPNLIWMPGYWAYAPEGGYYWVPGAWVAAPQPGLLWTPGYWGWRNGVYAFNSGYWGPHVGFYGGVNYGFGYGGVGFVGGEWRGGVFAYNTAVMHVDTTVIHNTYINKTVIRNTTIVNNRTSFNGGPGGVPARPTQQEQAFANERHIPPTSAQTRQVDFAKQDHANYAAVNHGMPAHAALPRPASSPADFTHAVPARGAKPAPFAAEKAEATPNAAAAERPAARAEAKPAPEARTAPRPAPEARQASRPAPEARQAARPAPQPKAQGRPAAKPERRPEEEKRPNK
jgi:hypothetical protein